MTTIHLLRNRCSNLLAFTRISLCLVCHPSPSSSHASPDLGQSAFWPSRLECQLCPFSITSSRPGIVSPVLGCATLVGDVVVLRTALVSPIVHLSLGHGGWTPILGILDDVDVVYGCLAGGADVAVNGYLGSGHFHREVEVSEERIGTETSTHLI
jgi:hypothetical protein